MKTETKKTESGISLFVTDHQEKILIDAGMGQYEAEKYQRKFDNMIARFRNKIISDMEEIFLIHNDPDDWDYKEKVKEYQNNF